MPRQAPRASGVWGSQISRQSVHEDGKVVSPTHRPPLPPKIFLVLIPVRGLVDPRAIVRPEGLCQWKIPVTSSGIEPATCRLVAQCLNQLRNRVPQIKGGLVNYSLLKFVLNLLRTKSRYVGCAVRSFAQIHEFILLLGALLCCRKACKLGWDEAMKEVNIHQLKTEKIER